jgi:hypothetical protein
MLNPRALRSVVCGPRGGRSSGTRGTKLDARCRSGWRELRFPQGVCFPDIDTTMIDIVETTMLVSADRALSLRRPPGIGVEQRATRPHVLCIQEGSSAGAAE